MPVLFVLLFVLFVREQVEWHHFNPFRPSAYLYLLPDRLITLPLHAFIQLRQMLFAHDNW